MGEYSPPTSADYAWSAAESAKRVNGELEKRVAELELKYRQLRDEIDSLWSQNAHESSDCMCHEIH